jgi:hypothetical protein
MNQQETREGLKTLKISPEVHKKLKVYCAESGENMTEIADTAILSMLAVKQEKKKK